VRRDVVYKLRRTPKIMATLSLYRVSGVHSLESVLAIDTRSRLLDSRESYGYSTKRRVGLIASCARAKSDPQSRRFHNAASSPSRRQEKVDNQANEPVRGSRNFARFVLITK